MFLTIRRPGWMLSAVLSLCATTFAQGPVGTAFTYQGRVKLNGNLVGNPTASDCEFQFGLFDVPSGGTALATLTQTLPVSNGLFTATLDYGGMAFTGQQRWIEVSLRCPPGVGSLVTVLPRQRVDNSPNALRSQIAPWSGLTGVPAGFADNVDNDTQYAAGAGLQLSGTTFSIPTGGVTLGMLAASTLNWANFSGIPAGFADNVDNDTTYAAGTGLQQNGTTFFIPTGAITNSLLGGGSVTSTKLASDAGSLGQVSGGVLFSSGAKIGVGSSIVSAGTNARLTVEDGDNQLVLRQTSAGGADAAGMVFNTVLGFPGFHIQRRSSAGDFEFTAVTVNLTTGQMTVAGNVCASNVTCPSDARFKTDITPLPDALARLTAIRPVTFRWQTEEFRDRGFDQGRHVGFVAQDLLQVLPDAVVRGDDGYYGVDYGRLTPVLTAAIQELHTQLGEKENRVAELEARVAEQDRRLGAQNGRIMAQEQRLAAIEDRLRSIGAAPVTP